MSTHPLWTWAVHVLPSRVARSRQHAGPYVSVVISYDTQLATGHGRSACSRPPQEVCSITGPPVQTSNRRIVPDVLRRRVKVSTSQRLLRRHAYAAMP
ncbi:hypothetical protein BD413DRAFT_507163 [Trametes elegans]|nr:hypothetical protein BD413DRAFT_507163 [Trametes elegans]